MKKILLVLILFTTIFQSCTQCGECFTPPQFFNFELVDKVSGENLFTNKTFDSNKITITDELNDNKPIEFLFMSENNRNLIQIGAIGWKTETVNLKFNISGKHIFTFYVDAERVMGDCCSHTEYNKITLTDSEFELNTETGIYKVFVE